MNDHTIGLKVDRVLSSYCIQLGQDQYSGDLCMHMNKSSTSIFRHGGNYREGKRKMITS